MARGWSDMRAEFPAEAQLAQSRIIQAVRDGDYVRPSWCSIELTAAGDPTLTAFYDVWCDALRIGKPGDSVRPVVTHSTAQAIADLLGVRVLTSKLIDDIDAQAIQHVAPLLKKNSTKVSAMVEHSNAIDAKLSASPGELVGGIGKQWINHPRLARPQSELYGKDTAINYGWSLRRAVSATDKRPWQSASRPRELSVWQQPGGRHNAGIADVNTGHTDRSQFARYGSNMLTVNEGGMSMAVPVDFAALDLRLSRLVSVDGPVMMRHPWIPICQTLAEGGQCPNVPPPAPREPNAPPKAEGGAVAVAGLGLAGVALAWYLWAHG